MLKDMRIPLVKLKAILRFFGTYTDVRFLGKVKLMKLFYFADFLHVKEFGCPITNDKYVKLEHGPIPTTILNLVNTAIDDVDNSLLADSVYFEKIDGIDMVRVHMTSPFVESDEKYFKPSELKILDNVCKRFGDKNTKYIVEASHSESPWKDSAMLADISYSMAANDPDCLITKEEIELLQGI